MRQFLRQKWPIKLPFLRLTVRSMVIPSLTVCNIYFIAYMIGPADLHSKLTFQNFPCISDILSEVSKFQYHTTLRSKCITLLVYSLSLKSGLPVDSFFVTIGQKYQELHMNK
jgi:hypothetical protein